MTALDTAVGRRRFSGTLTASGVTIALVAYSSFSVSDASVKLLRGRIDPFEVAFFGSLCAIPVLPFVKAPGDRYSDIFRTTHRGIWLLRTIAVAISIVTSIVAFTLLPMPEAFSIIFLMPMFVTLLSVALLKEKVGPVRWASVMLGFVGVLVVLRPGFRVLGFGHFAAFLVGLSAAIAVIAYRLAKADEKKISLFGTTIVGPLVTDGFLMIPHFKLPQTTDVWFILSYGGLAAIGQLLIMLAARKSPASLLAATQYIQMLWAIALGYLLFHEPISVPTWIGVIIILGSGMIPWARERFRAAVVE